MTVQSILTWKFTNKPDPNNADRFTTDAHTHAPEVKFAEGTGNTQANEMWWDRRLVTASTPTDDIDLYGSLENVFGRTINFSKIKAVGIQNLGKRDGNGGWTLTAGEDLLVLGATAANNGWGGILNGNQDEKIQIESGDIFLITNRLAGWSISAGSTDVLRVVNNGTDDIEYDIVIGGVRA